MTEVQWRTSCVPRELVAHIKKTNNLRKMRLFVCGCCRRIWDVIPDERSRVAVLVAERFADDAATDDELDSARTAAGEAVRQYRGYDRARDSETFSGTETCYYAAVKDPRQALYAWHDSAERALAKGAKWHDELSAICDLLRDIFGNPFRPVVLNPSWLTSTVQLLARGIYDERAFDRMPILADALQDAGCDDDILNHCRDEKQVHVRGCWVVDLVLGKS